MFYDVCENWEDRIELRESCKHEVIGAEEDGATQSDPHNAGNKTSKEPGVNKKG